MSLIAELKRRNVFRVGVAYAIVAWLLVEVASVVLPTFKAPEWVMQVFTFLVVLGFPLALIVAWAFELTPEGIKRETAVDPAESRLSKHDPEGRRLAAIMFTDIVDYTALMGRDEAVGRRVQEHHEAVVGSLVARYQGEWLEERGDETLSVFGNVRDAVNCALAIQQALRDDPELKLRIGVHLGDVTFEQGRVIGDGVNVASRIRALAEPGGTCISDEVQHSVRNQSNIETHVLGTRELKNVPSPVTLYQVTGTPTAPPSVAPPLPTVKPHALDWRAGAAVVIALVALAVVFLFVDNYALEAEPEQASVVREKSIAVLPFVNMSGDPEQEFFSDGISEELLNTLTAIEGLRVVGRTSSFSFKGKDVDLRTIGESLGVTNILEGSVRQSGGRIRITAQLISAADGFHLWSHSYDRELADIFETQEEIAGEIARALQVELGFRVAQSVARRATDNLAAYTWTLRGADLYSRSDVTNLEKARAFFNKAIELDPEYVPAYIGHARASVELIGWGRGPAGDLLDDAERSLREAELLDPGSSAVHASRGLVSAYRHDVVGAERAFKKALELDPNDYWSQQAWADVLSQYLGRPQEAAELYEVLRWREPLDLRIASNYAMALMQAGRVDEAERELQRIIEIEPNNSTGRFFQAVLEAYFQNQIALAISSNAMAFELDPESVYPPLESVRFFLSLGDDASAERWAELGEHNSAGGYLGKEMRFRIALYRGDEKSAESISRGMAGTVQSLLGGNRYIDNFSWLRLLHRADSSLAMQVYARLYPELLQDEPQVNAWNHAAAISLADLLRRSGNDATADSLLEKSLSVIGETTDRWYLSASVTAYLLQGKTDRALTALREDIDAGWRVGWWALEREPIYESLWDQPEFQAMMAEIKADMAEQLAQVREMERNGELEPIPEISAATQ